MKKALIIMFRVILVLVMIPVTGVLAIFLNYHLIALVASGRIHEKTADIGFREHTLVMGAGNYKPEMWINHTFNHRMYTTAALFTEKKTEKIIASGTRISDQFDEVAEMRQVLMEYGIPDSAITTDYGGVRTWASVHRAHEYHKVDSIIIVSQHDQLERAIFIASCIGMDAIGMEAEPSPRQHRFWTIREYLARVKCTLDCITYIFTFS